MVGADSNTSQAIVSIQATIVTNGSAAACAASYFVMVVDRRPSSASSDEQWIDDDGSRVCLSVVSDFKDGTLSMVHLKYLYTDFIIYNNNNLGKIVADLCTNERLRRA